MKITTMILLNHFEFARFVGTTTLAATPINVSDKEHNHNPTITQEIIGDTLHNIPSINVDKHIKDN